MRVRCITISLVIAEGDFENQGLVLEVKLRAAQRCQEALTTCLTSEGYEVQTVRVSLNSFESWLLTRSQENTSCEVISNRLDILISILKKLGIVFCSIGPCTRPANLQLIPSILAASNALATSFQCTPSTSQEDFQAVARVCIALSKLSSTTNFSFCVSANCPPYTPFFPVAYCDPDLSSNKMAVSLGLENGDLLFLGLFKSTDLRKATNTLKDCFRQILLPIQRILEQQIAMMNSSTGEFTFIYAGIDSSINPGGTLPESIGNAFEQTFPYRFGKMGTLSIVSSITAALKGINHDGDEIVKLCGYCGLMFPVMEDVVLASRAMEGTFTIRDLLLFSTVCGVGIDTVPIPGDVSEEILSGLYMEITTLAYRLNKPLSCRLLPFQGLVAGEVTDIKDNPYLINTTVFEL